MTNEKKRNCVKYICYGVLTFVFWILQLKVLSGVRIFGEAPFIAVFLTTMIGGLEGSFPGAIAGYIIGMFADAASAYTEGFYAVALLLTGFFSGVTTTYLLKKKYASLVIIGSVAYLIMQFFFFFVYLFITERMEFSAIVSIPLGLVSTMIFTPPVFGAYWLIYRKFRIAEENEESAAAARVRNLKGR